MQERLCRKANQRHKKLPVFSLLLFVALFFCGCGLSASHTHPEITPTPTPVQGNQNIVPATPTQQVEFVLSEKKEIYFYTVNPETLETEAVSAVVDEEFADEPEELMVLVTDSLEDAGYEIEIRSALVDGENVVVDFSPDMHPASGLGKQEEKAVLDAIAQSLLDNLIGQRGVVFRIMGEAYESENFSFGLYYVYMKNNHK